MKKILIGLLVLGSFSSFAKDCIVSPSQLTNLEKETLYRAGIELTENVSDPDSYYEFKFEKNIYYLNGNSEFMGANSMASHVPARMQAKATLFKVSKGKYSDTKEVIKSIKGSKIGIHGQLQGTNSLNVDKKLKRYRAKLIKKLVEICS